MASSETEHERVDAPRRRTPSRVGGGSVGSREHRIRARVSRALLAVDLVNLGLTMAGNHGPARFVFGLVLVLAVPGWAVIGHLRLGNAALELSLTTAVSLSLLMVAAQALITLHSWHLVALEVVVCLACLPSLFWLSYGTRRSESYSR
jgi:uncharacterized membrane protein